MHPTGRLPSDFDRAFTASPPPPVSAIASIRTLALALFVAGSIYVATFAVLMGGVIGPRAATLQDATETVRAVLDELVLTGRRADALLAATQVAREDPARVSELTDRLAGVPESAAVIGAQRLAKIPAELRIVLGEAASTESLLVSAIREATANIELDRRAATVVSIAQADSLGGALTAHLSEAQRLGYENLTEQQADLNELAGQVARWLLWWILAGAAAIPAMFLLIRGRVLRPLATLDEGLAKVAAGHFDATLEIERNDEIGRLSHHFNRMTGVLRARAEADSAAFERVEDELRMSGEYLRSFVEYASDMITVVESDGTLRFASPSVEAVLGFKPEEVVGMSAFDLVHPEDRAEVMALFKKGIQDPDREERALLRYAHRDGTWRHVEVVARNLLNHPAVKGIVIVSRDITDLRQREDELRQARKMEAVGQLTGGVAHDFNNLLTVVIGNLELLEEELGEEGRLKEYVREAMKAANRGADLTQGLLAFSRRQPLRPRIVDLRKLVGGMVDLMRRTLGETIDIELVGASDLWNCEVDPTQLETVVLNLGINARDAMEDGGRLTIEFGNAHLDADYVEHHPYVEAGEYVMLAVADSGHGMEADVVEKAFEPFFTTKDVGRGSGLGLSMVYGFVKQSGGHVDLTSEPGEGTTVTIYLPRVHQTESAPDPKALPGPEPIGDGELILVVEDHGPLRALAVELLARLGYATLAAEDGHEALEVLRTEEGIAVLFTDVVLPGGMSGADLARQARDLRPDLKVLYTSGYSEDAVTQRGRLDPGVDLLEKPYGRSDLAFGVARALNA